MQKLDKRIWAGVGFIVVIIIKEMAEQIFKFAIASLLEISFSDLLSIIGLLIGSFLVAWAFYDKRKNKVSKGLYFYSSRSEQPPFVDFVSQAKQNVHFFGQSLEKLARQHVGTIEEAINRGVSFQFWVLKPDSRLVRDWDAIMFGDTTNAVNNSLRTLCRKKKELQGVRKNQLRVGTYDFVPLNSMIALDAETEDAKLLVEFPFYKLDADKRPSILVSKKDQTELFEKLWNSYRIVCERSKEYDCQ